MNLVLVGLSHKTAPVNIREKLHFPEPQVPGALEQLRSPQEMAAMRGKDIEDVLPFWERKRKV